MPEKSYVDKIYVVYSLDNEIILVTDNSNELENMLIDGAKDSANGKFFCAISILRPEECENAYVFVNSDDYEYGISHIKEDDYSDDYKITIGEQYEFGDYTDLVESLRDLHVTCDNEQSAESCNDALYIHSSHWETSPIELSGSLLAIKISSSVLFRLLEKGFHAENLIVSTYEDNNEDYE